MFTSAVGGWDLSVCQRESLALVSVVWTAGVAVLRACPRLYGQFNVWSVREMTLIGWFYPLVAVSPNSSACTQVSPRADISAIFRSSDILSSRGAYKPIQQSNEKWGYKRCYNLYPWFWILRFRTLCDKYSIICWYGGLLPLATVQNAQTSWQLAANSTVWTVLLFGLTATAKSSSRSLSQLVLYCQFGVYLP